MKVKASQISSFARVVIAGAFVLLVVGCAQLPNAKVTYYLPKTEVRFNVVRTIGCDRADNLLVGSAVTPVVTHSADPLASRELSLTGFKTAFSDADIKLDYYDDGRLKSFNATATGQGESILKTAISVFDAAVGFLAAKGPQKSVCAAIRTATGDKPLTLSYAGTADPGVTADKPILPDPATKVLVGALNLEPLIGGVCVSSDSAIVKPAGRAMYIEPDRAKRKAKRDLYLEMREPAFAKFKVTSGDGGACDANTIWEGSLPVAHLGIAYDLPLQHPTAFGKGTLAASFNDAGSLTLIQYVANTGAAQALNVIGGAQTATQSTSSADKAAALKAEADLIAQQQRLMQCRSDPTNCK
jgi:hypothetical protein